MGVWFGGGWTLRMIVCLVIATWLPISPALSAGPFDAELRQQTQQLGLLIRDSIEEVGLDDDPVMVPIDCEPQKEMASGPCEPGEALVPFFISGTGGGNAVWSYVARFKILAPESAIETEMREFASRERKHVALVDFAWIPFEYGIIDWATAKVAAGHVDLATRHWAGQGGSAPAMPGVVRITLAERIEFQNLPGQ